MTISNDISNIINLSSKVISKEIFYNKHRFSIVDLSVHNLSSYLRNIFSTSTYHDLIATDNVYIDKLFSLNETGSKTRYEINVNYLVNLIDDEIVTVNKILKQMIKIIDDINSQNKRTEVIKEIKVFSVEDFFNEHLELKRMLLMLAIANKDLMKYPIVKYLVFKEAEEMDIAVERFNYMYQSPIVSFNPSFKINSRMNPFAMAMMMMMR